MILVLKFTDFDWTAFTAAVIAVLTLLFSLYVYHKDQKNKSSQFFLEKSKSYFIEGSDIIATTKYSYLKWSNAIELLLTGHGLLHKITDKNHQIIYMTEYRKAVYKILETIITIKDFRFFYGIPNYEGQDASMLRQRNLPKIDQERLLSLCVFLDKADTDNYNTLDYNEIYMNKYFREKINEEVKISDKTKASMDVIFKYIKNEKS